MHYYHIYYYIALRSICNNFFLEHLVYIQGGAATPMELIRAMTEHGVCNNLRGVRLLNVCLEGDTPFVNPEFESIRNKANV